MFRKVKRISRQITKAYSGADRLLGLLGVHTSGPTTVNVSAPIKQQRLAWLPFRKPPQPHWRDYEIAAVSFLKGLGFAHAKGADPGADGGVDVRVPGVLVGQVKAHAAKTGRPQLQQIFGVAAGEGNVEALFFSKSGYTKNATEWANQNGIILLQVVYQQESFVVTAVNPAGRNFVTSCRRRL